MKESAKLGDKSSAEAMRRVGSARLVGEHVVPSMISHPANRAALERHGSGGDQQQFEQARRDERLMRQHAVETDGDPVAAEEVQPHREQDVAKVDALSPEPDDAEHESEDGSDDDRAGDDLLPTAWPERGDIRWGRDGTRGGENAEGHAGSLATVLPPGGTKRT